MPITLIEAAKQANDPLKSGVIEMFAQSSELLRVLPFENISGNAIKYNREGELPGVAFRGVNEAYSEDAGVLNPVTESLVIAGGDLDVDKFIIDTQGAAVRATHEAMKIKALAASISKKIIKGDSDTDPREFDGLQKRLTGNQVITAGAGTGTALSLKKLDEVIDAVMNPTHIIVSKAIRRLLSAAARSSSVGGYITYQPDEFGRKVAYYNDLPLIVLEDADGSEILGFDEAASGAASPANTCSLYVVSLAPDKMTGIQNGVMDVRDLGELNTKPVFRTRIEWYNGLCLYHGRSAARLRDITNAAVTA